MIPSVLLVIRKYVAPLAGAWIEMRLRKKEGVDPVVAPLAGAWIEMYFTSIWFIIVFVAPLAGAWIEMGITDYFKIERISRSPRGSVD